MGAVVWNGINSTCTMEIFAMQRLAQCDATQYTYISIRPLEEDLINQIIVDARN